MSLEVKIKKTLGKFRLDMAFEADSGILALLGASGSGKSMTLKCIAGIETPDEGRIVLDGQVLFDSSAKINLTPQKRNVGYLFQQYALFPNMTARQNIACAIKGPRDIRKKTADEFISSMYLDGLGDKYPSELSGGQQQRVALARILAGSPQILLLDEPFSALDSYLQWRLEMELTDTLAAFGGLTLFVSHNRDEVYRISNNVCVIDNGKSEPVIPVAELFESPGTVPAALLSGCKNYSRAEKRSENSVFAADWNTELVTSETVRDDICFVGVRSHYIRPACVGDANILSCSIKRVTPELFETAVMLLPDGAESGSDYAFIRMDIAKTAWDTLDNSKEFSISIDPRDILLLK